MSDRDPRELLLAARRSDLGRTRLPPRVWFDARKLSEETDQRRRDLYAKGWSDKRIAAAEDVDRTTIFQWRRNRGLKSHNPAPKLAARAARDLDERRRLIAMGLSDREVAQKQKCNRSSVRNWRVRQGIPANFASVEERKGRGDGRQYLPSLDATLSGFEGLDMHGVLADPSWSDWLEEMGATVW